MREVEDICRSDEFRTFNRSTGQQIPELLHERQTKWMAFFEGPGEGCSPLVPDVPAIEVPLCRKGFSAAC
jgi:hypothetical protein